MHHAWGQPHQVQWVPHWFSWQAKKSLHAPRDTMPQQHAVKPPSLSAPRAVTAIWHSFVHLATLLHSNRPDPSLACHQSRERGARSASHAPLSESWQCVHRLGADSPSALPGGDPHCWHGAMPLAGGPELHRELGACFPQVRLLVCGLLELKKDASPCERVLDVIF